MSLQSSTFTTAHVLDNEIVKSSDFEFAFEKIAENVSRATQMILESNQDFVINGKVTPYQGMAVQIAPIYGVCKSTGIPFGRTESDVMEYAFSESENGRVDIIEVHGEWETYDEQQRAFNDPDTDVKTYQYVDTKKLMKPVFKIVTGVEGSNVAPEVEEGYVKLAEVVIRPLSTSIIASDIKNITSDIAGLDNEGWTTQKDITYNIGYISDVNERFRVQHKADGTHKDNVINTDSLDIGTGTKQVNGNVLPVGGNVSLPGETVVATDSILSVIVKSAALISSLYNNYLKYGTYGFKGDISISSLADENNDLTKPLTIHVEGDGTAVIKVDGNAVLSIDANGKLSTNGYTASSNNHLVTKAVTDAISTALTNLTGRVTNVENAIVSQVSYADGTISMGNTGRFNVDNDITINIATTANINELVGIPIVDGVQTASGNIILVKDQTDPTQNGIYTISQDSSWTRGYNGNYDTPDKLKNKIFNVLSGTANGGRMFYVAKTQFVNGSQFGTDDIPILEYMATSKAKNNRIILRDANGRAQVAAPSAEADIARKAEITALYGNTVGQALGTAAVGTCTTFARSDHVHPTQNYIPYTGVGNGVMTAYQTSAAYCGSTADWASYLIFNHGDGSSYYNQMIRMPFGGVPQYQRKSEGTNSGWKTFITSENIASQSVASATNATNATNATCLSGFINTKNTAKTSNEWLTNGIGYYSGGNNTSGNPNSGQADGSMFAQANSDCWINQIAMDYRTGRAYFRARCNGTWTSWLTNIDSGNIASQSVKYACCASYNGSGEAFGSAATCAATDFRPNTWKPTKVDCSDNTYISQITTQNKNYYLLFSEYTSYGYSSPSRTTSIYYNPYQCALTTCYFCGSLCGLASRANYANCIPTSTSGTYATICVQL